MEATIVIVIASLETIRLYIPSPSFLAKSSSSTQPGPGQQEPRGA
jgi:hypothetical protein